MNIFGFFASLLIVLMLTSCSSDGDKRPAYIGSESLQSLEIPPQLSRPNTAAALKIPKPSAQALERLNQQEKVKGKVSPLFKGIQLESEAGLYWLSIDVDADKLWPSLIDFWANEGIKLEREEPLLGFMETEWVKEFQPKREGNAVTQWLNSFAADQLDRFRMRIERTGKNSSRVYVSHRGLELQLEEDGTSWQARASEPVLEHEILKRLELFAGLSQSQVKYLFDDYKPYQSRVRPTEQSNHYEIIGNGQFVWQRLLHELDRLDVEILSQDKTKNIIDVRVGKIAAELKESEEKDELAESSWLMNLLSNTDDEQTSADVHLEITINNNSSVLAFSLVGGGKIKSGLAEEFRNSLMHLLK